MVAAVKELRQELDRTTAQAEKLLLGHSEQQSVWQPNGGRSWSIAECLGHLSATHRLYCAAIEAAMTKAPRVGSTETTIRPGVLSRVFLRMLEPPVKVRVPANGKILPKPNRNVEEVWREFQASQAEIARLMEKAATVDANRVRFENPLAKQMRFTAGTGLMIMLAHLRRHLWQAERVTEQPDFPPPASR